MGIALEVIGMVVQTVFPKMVMAKIEHTTGMVVVLVEVLIGMEVECRHGRKEGVTGVGQALMTAQAGVVARLRLIATNCF